MNILSHLHLLENVHGGIVNDPRRENQPGCADDDFNMRDKDAIARAAIPNSHHPITSILWNSSVDEETGHAVTVDDVHSNSPPLSNDDDHRMPRGNCINYFEAFQTIRLRTASCAVSEHSTFATDGQLGVAA